MNPHINFLGFAIPVYGLLSVVAAFLAWLVMVLLSKKKEINTEDVSLVYLIGVSCGIAGAYLLRPLMKAAEVAIFWQRYDFASAPELLNYLFGEIVFYGGFIGGLIGVVVFCRRFKIRIIPLFDIAAPALAFAHAIGRVGCFFGGCCYGIEMPENHPFSVIYPPASLSAPPGIPLLAVPLIEAAFLGVLFVALMFVFLKSKRPGICAAIYLLVYPVGRFILEFFRGDAVRGFYGSLTTSQFISVAVFIFGGICFVNAIKAGKPQPE